MNALDKSYIERHYHLSWGDGWHRSPVYGLPVLKPESYIPDRLIPFDKINDAQETNGCVTFNLADRRIDRIWTSPEKYIPRLMKFDCITTPDFSLLLDMDRAFIEYNLLRSLKLGRHMQDLGMRVLPSAMWACPDTYDICFEALPRHSVIFVSTVGSVRSAESRKYFTMGIREMTARLEPTGLILYGPVPALDFDIPVVRHFDRISPAHFNSYQPSLI